MRQEFLKLFSLPLCMIETFHNKTFFKGMRRLTFQLACCLVGATKGRGVQWGTGHRWGWGSRCPRGDAHSRSGRMQSARGHAGALRARTAEVVVVRASREPLSALDRGAGGGCLDNPPPSAILPQLGSCAHGSCLSPKPMHGSGLVCSHNRADARIKPQPSGHCAQGFPGGGSPSARCPTWVGI